MSTVNGQHIRVFGSLLLFLADTLAAHQLGGFKVGVGFSLRKCRNCLATAEEMNEYVSLIHIVLEYYTFTYIISFVITYFFRVPLSFMNITVL